MSSFEGFWGAGIYELFTRNLSRSYAWLRSLCMAASILIFASLPELKMNITVMDRSDQRIAGSVAAPIPRTLRRWTAGLFVSVILGAMSGLAGLVTGFLTLTGIVTPSTALYTTGTVLLGASFVLFGLAAHCLDKADAADKAMRLEYCRQHGLQD